MTWLKLKALGFTKNFGRSVWITLSCSLLLGKNFKIVSK